MNNSILQPRLYRFVFWVLAVLLILPFLISWRIPPYMDFYQDVVVVCSVCTIIILVSLEKQFAFPISRPTICFILLAAYWLLQTVILDLAYPSQNIRTALLFVSFAFLCWAVQSLISHCGKEKVFTWVMWCVSIGAGLQSIVAILQFTELAKPISWLIYFYEGNIGGQFGQRNMLGHQLMWGVLASAFLTARHHVKQPVGYMMIVWFGLVLALVNSRTIVAYLLAIFVFLCIVKIITKTKDRVFRLMIVSAVWVLFAQLFLPFFLGLFELVSESGAARLIDNSDISIRLIEWEKAWQVFTEYPIFGSGYDSYTYHSLTKTLDFTLDTRARPSGYASHCHNSILQILAEMGIVGLALVLGSLIWVCLPMLKRLGEGENTVVLALLLISGCHSLFEYPLWYSYFLASFTLFIIIGQPVITKERSTVISRNLHNILIVVAGLGLTLSLALLSLHQWRIASLVKVANGSISMKTARAHATFALGTVYPLLTIYRDQGILRAVESHKKAVDPEALQIIARLTRGLPNPHVSEHYGFNLYHYGNIEKSIDWFAKVWDYYPRMVPHSMKVIYDNTPMFKELEKPVYESCKRYRALDLYPTLFSSECEAPPLGNKAEITD